MAWLVLACGVIVSIELLLRLAIGKAISELVRTSHRTLKTIASSGVSDHWKEKAVLRYAARIFGLSTRLFLTILAASLPFLIIVAAEEQLGRNPMEFYGSLHAIAAGTAIGVAYAWIRSKVG